MHLHAKRNEYADLLGDLLDKAPKAVVAAVVVSLLTSGGDHPEVARSAFLEEWGYLHAAGIVPQRPPTEARP